MMTRHLTIGALMALTACIVTRPVMAAAADPQVHSQDGLSYVSGGIGDEERRAIETMSNRFNLKLTMALKTGDFVGDTRVRIQDSQSQTLLDTVADGPLFLAQLKPGTYTITCSLNGKELKETAHIASGKQEQLVFTWTAE